MSKQHCRMLYKSNDSFHKVERCFDMLLVWTRLYGAFREGVAWRGVARAENQILLSFSASCLNAPLRARLKRYPNSLLALTRVDVVYTVALTESAGGIAIPRDVLVRRQKQHHFSFLVLDRHNVQQTPEGTTFPQPRNDRYGIHRVP